MRDFDAACAERERQIDHVGDVIDIGAVHHGVDGERQLAPHHVGGERTLARECALIAGDMIGGLLDAVLDGDLHVIEAGVVRAGPASCR